MGFLNCPWMGILDVDASSSFVDKNRIHLAEIVDVANFFTHPPRSLLCVIVIDDTIFQKLLRDANEEV